MCYQGVFTRKMAIFCHMLLVHMFFVLDSISLFCEIMEFPSKDVLPEVDLLLQNYV